MTKQLLIAVIFTLVASQAQGTIIEAETMTPTGATNKAVTDGWGLLGEAKLTTTYTFSSMSAKLDIVAKGSYAGGGWPLMEVKIGGVLYDTITVDSATWKTFTIAAQVSPAVPLELTVAFINDYYDGTPETDRNLYIDKLIIWEESSGQVTLAWDANVEPDLKGYIIYWGEISRYDPAVHVGIPAIIKDKCNLPDTGELNDSQKSCKESWEKFCSIGEPDPPDPACDSDYFKYQHSVDVKNVTEYTLTGLTKGVKYYLAATAYDEDYPKFGHESKFSEELSHVVTDNPADVKNFKKIPKP